MLTKPKLIVFDVNETLLDLTPLKLKVNKVMDNEIAFDLWFSNILHYSLVETVTEKYSDFTSIAAATFRMLLQKFKIDQSDREIKMLLATIKSLPPHVGVIDALTQLKKAGFTLVALTNGNQEIVENQLVYAEIDTFFRYIISVEHIGRYKPNVKTYTHVLKEMKIAANDSIMVAAHGWDAVGAKRAGMQTAFVARDGASMYPLGDCPDITGKSVLEIAEKLIQL